MVKKVKRFIVFILFSFFYSLLFGKNSDAKSLCVVAKNSKGRVMYHGYSLGVDANSVSIPACAS